MLREAFRYPTRGDDAVETLLVGGGLHLLVAVVPLAAPVAFVLVVGYLSRVLSRLAVGDERRDRARAVPPTFRGVGGVLRRGVGATLVVAAYSLVPATLLGVTVGGVIGSAGRGLTEGVGSLVLLVGALTTLFLALAFLYPLPAALGAYAATGRLRAAFDRGTLVGAVTDSGYLVAVCGAAACLAGAAVAATTLDRVVVGFFLAFYLEVVAVTVAGVGVLRAVGSLADPVVASGEAVETARDDATAE